MPHQPYFVVVLAHSLHGRLRRIHVPHKAMYAVFALALVGCVSIFGFLSSYLRMSLKVANYNSLRQEVTTLRQRYQELQKVNNQKSEQLATLENFASEVSVAYGLRRRPGTSSDIAADNSLTPSFPESLNNYNFLQTASFTTLYRNYPKQWQTHVRPSLWPVEGRIMSAFGIRTDPFSGEGAIHTGVDLSAPMGTSGSGRRRWHRAECRLEQRLWQAGDHRSRQWARNLLRPPVAFSKWCRGRKSGEATSSPSRARAGGRLPRTCTMKSVSAARR